MSAMSCRSPVAFAASTLALFLSTRPTAANGRLPTANQLLFSGSDASLVVLRTTFGLLLSRDGGTTWAWLCEDALGVSSSSTEDPSLAIAANGNLVAGFSSGLSVSQDLGCDWSFAGGPLANQFVVDLTVRPQAPDVLLALTSTFGRGVADGSPGYANQVLESTDDGGHWIVRGAPLDPSAIMTTLETAATDANRIYVTAQRAAATATASFFVSTDAGATWTEHAVALDPNGSESSIYIAAVDPTNAERVYLRTSAQTTLSSQPSAKPSRLLVSDDGGSTFRTAISLTGQMLGFALSSDASMVFAGSVEDGLFVAGATDLSFQKLASIHVKCLATHGSELWACSDDATGFIAGVSMDGGATFVAKAHLTAEPMLMCAGDATASAQCSGAPREALCKALPGCDLDGGGAPAGGGASGHAQSSGRGCGCSLQSADSGVACAAVCAFVGLGVARRHARRRH
jgi:hypothetical protein